MTRRAAGALVALLAGAAPAAASQHLAAAPMLPIKRLYAGPVTTGDFDGNGHVDLAYALHNPTGVAVLLGDGQGHYDEPLVSQIASQTQASAEAIVAGDFNGDGRLDLALADFATGPAVYLGLGDGRFAGSSLGGDLLNLGLAVGDYDGDGRRDLALSRRGFTSVAQVLVYKGNGAGGFAPVTWNLPTLQFPSGLVTRDFNGDGRDDLAVADSFGNSVAVLLGSPTLALDLRGPFPAGAEPMRIDAGDLDGDGRLDVVTANRAGRSVSILRGDGTGAFGPHLTIEGPKLTRDVRLADFDGDGRLDVAAAGEVVWVYAGDGAGGLTTPRRYGLAGSLAVGELTGDGRLDLVAGMSLLAGDGAGGFAAQRTYPVPADGRGAVAADFDRDGHLDVATIHGDGRLALLRGDGAGSLGAPTTTLTGTGPADVVAGDLNRDGWLDLAIAHSGTLDVAVLLNDRLGGFTRRSYAVGGVPQSLALGDFGNDGATDIAVANATAGAILVLHGLGDGTFAPSQTTAVGSGSLALVSGAFNADGRTDLAWFRAPSANVPTQILAGTGAETFVPGPPVGPYASEHALVATDVNADGRLDLVGGGDSQPFGQVSGLGVLLGDGAGGFSSPVPQPPLVLRSLAVADFTQDGRPDVAAYQAASQTNVGLYLLKGAGDGSFGLFDDVPLQVGGSFGSAAVLPGDFDHDGRNDAAVLVGPSETVTLLLGRPASPGADVSIDVVATPDPVAGGQPVHYVATVVNHGPLAASGVRVQFRTPLGLAYIGHSPGLPLCAESVGFVTCTVAQMAPGASFVLTVDAGTSPDSGGTPGGWADAHATQPDEVDPSDNFTTFRTQVSPVDAAVFVADSVDPVLPGQAFRYTITLANQGAFAATSVLATATLPAGVTLVDVPRPSCASFDDVTVYCGINTLLPGQTVSFDVDVQAGTFTSVELAVSLDTDQLDVDPADNAAVEETRMLLQARGELSHGVSRRLALSPGAPAEDRFLVRVPARTSFEVVLDERSGDLDGGAAPVGLERLDADTSSVLQFGLPLGTGPARVLRWQNSTDEAATQLVRVRSLGCSSSCGADDTYRIRAWESTAFFARFNTTQDQEAVVLLQNPAASGIATGTLWFWGTGGALLDSYPFVLPARRSLALNVATILPGAAGSITLSHDAGYGGLLGKAVAIEPATGFSYDTPLVPRPR